MKKGKKVLSLLLVLMMLFSVAGCQSQPTVETYNNKGHSTPIILNSTYRSIGLSNISVSYKSSRADAWVAIFFNSCGAKNL